MLAELQKLTLDVGGKFVKSDGTSVIKDLISVDLSTKFSSIMKAKEVWDMNSFLINEKVNIGNESGTMLLQIGVKFSSLTDASKKPKIFATYAIS